MVCDTVEGKPFAQRQLRCLHCIRSPWIRVAKISEVFVHEVRGTSGVAIAVVELVAYEDPPPLSLNQARYR